MCGIAGVISWEPLTESEHQAVARMTRTMVRRGPDDEGYYRDEHVSLGMRRLSIIDVAGGHQPIHSDTGDEVVICNGEIYNFVELRESLIPDGYRFSSRSDVEVILPLYQRHRSDCARWMRGMFAFALWDKARRRLLLGRDRLGEKPLYLYQDADKRLWFASEMKALLAGLEGRERPSTSAQSAYLFLIFQYVPEPATMFEGVTKLPAGHVLEVAVDDLPAGLPASRAYWNYLAAPPVSGDPVATVRGLLEEATTLTLRSDVPVGIALSGGIDSSLIAVLARRHHAGPLAAFSVGYPGRPDNDERASAMALARSLDMPFHDIELSETAFEDVFAQLVFDMDDPVGDIAAYGYAAVSRLSRDHGVPVLLSGLGADELFWGYQWVRDAVRRNTGAARLGRLPLIGPLLSPARPTFYHTLDSMRRAASATTALMNPAALAGVPRDHWRSYDQVEVDDDLPLRLLEVQNRDWLASNCLALGDRLSMASSVEMRLPFLDSALVDAVTGLRRGGLNDWAMTHKWLLIEAIRDWVPAEILQRRKRGFTPPVVQWMDAVIRRFGRLVERGALYRSGIVLQEASEAVHRARPPGFGYRLTLLEVWARLFIDGMSPVEVAAAAGSR
jgi:asparagine synthase (glutamine-hydrolysing)